MAVLYILKESKSEGLDWTTVEDLVDLVSDQLEAPDVFPIARELGYTMDVDEDIEEDGMLGIGTLVGLFKQQQEAAEKEEKMTIACETCGHDWVVHYADQKPIYYNNHVMQPCQQEDCYCADFKDKEEVKEYSIEKYKAPKEPTTVTPAKPKYDAKPILSIIEGDE